MVVPEPAWMNDPEPEMVLVKVTVSERFRASVPSLVMLPTMEPVVPPSPICRVPRVMTVPPV